MYHTCLRDLSLSIANKFHKLLVSIFYKVFIDYKVVQYQCSIFFKVARSSYCFAFLLYFEYRLTMLVLTFSHKIVLVSIKCIVILIVFTLGVLIISSLCFMGLYGFQEVDLCGFSASSLVIYFTVNLFFWWLHCNWWMRAILQAHTIFSQHSSWKSLAGSNSIIRICFLCCGFLVIIFI